MNGASLGAIIGGLGALLGGLAAVLRAQLKPGDPIRLEVRALKAEVRSLRRELALSDALLEDARRDLRISREREYKLQDQLSDQRTINIGLRKLLPGGEWLEKLGVKLADPDDEQS